MNLSRFEWSVNAHLYTRHTYDTHETILQKIVTQQQLYQTALFEISLRLISTIPDSWYTYAFCKKSVMLTVNILRFCVSQTQYIQKVTLEGSVL